MRVHRRGAVYNALLEEALTEARETWYEGVAMRVVRAEHLVAICLQTGRAKARGQACILREQATLDSPHLANILSRHELERLFAAKEARRCALVALPFPEKVAAVIKLQEMAAPILRARGRTVRPWVLHNTDDNNDFSLDSKKPT